MAEEKKRLDREMAIAQGLVPARVVRRVHTDAEGAIVASTVYGHEEIYLQPDSGHHTRLQRQILDAQMKAAL
jgi:hypothetical protein